MSKDWITRSLKRPEDRPSEPNTLEPVSPPKRKRKKATQSKSGRSSKSNLAPKAEGAPTRGARGGWLHTAELAPAASELQVIRKARELGRSHLPAAVKVFIDGLSNESDWIRMVSARELLSRFGLPVMAQLKQTVEVASAPRRLYGFQDPYLEAGVVEAEFEEVSESDTRPEVSDSEDKP